MRPFRIGDRVRVINADCSDLIGTECTVTSNLHWTTSAQTGETMSRHSVDTTYMGYRCSFIPENLELIDDGNELVSWESCEFIPSELVTIGE